MMLPKLPSSVCSRSTRSTRSTIGELKVAVGATAWLLRDPYQPGTGDPWLIRLNLRMLVSCDALWLACRKTRWVASFVHSLIFPCFPSCLHYHLLLILSHSFNTMAPSSIPPIQWAANDNELIWSLLGEIGKIENFKVLFGKTEGDEVRYASFTSIYRFNFWNTSEHVGREQKKGLSKDRPSLASPPLSWACDRDWRSCQGENQWVSTFL